MCTAAGQPFVVARLLAVVGLVEAAGDVRVIVRLVHGDDGPSGVDHGVAQLSNAPYEPVVEARAADQKRWQWTELALRKDEVVERRVAP